MAVGKAHVFSGFLTPVPTQISFQSHQLLFWHASSEVRDENKPEINFASSGSQTRNDLAGVKTCKLSDSANSFPYNSDLL